MRARTLFAGSIPAARAMLSRASALPEPATSNPRGLRCSRTLPPSGTAIAVITTTTASNRQGRRLIRSASRENTTGPPRRRAQTRFLGLRRHAREPGSPRTTIRTRLPPTSHRPYSSLHCVPIPATIDQANKRQITGSFRPRRHGVDLVPRRADLPAVTADNPGGVIQGLAGQLRSLHSGMIVLLDRGLSSNALLAAVTGAHAEFLARSS